MRFFQASDFHLRPDRPERLDALREVIARASETGAHALLIPGDLFDDPASADALRPEVRRLLEEFPGSVLLLPGNHDPAPADGASAFPNGADYGRRTIVLTRVPWCEHTLRVDGEEPVRLVGAPYRGDTTLGRDLAGLDTDPLRSVLLAHGTLRAAWLERLRPSEGDESAYYPIREQDLRGRFAYAALGHIHDRATFDDWTAESAWGYSGSPVAVTRGEIGRRHAVGVEFRAGEGVLAVERVPLDTAHWAEPLEASVAPWLPAAEVVEELIGRIEKISETADAHRGLRVRLRGWMDADETRVREKLDVVLREVGARHRTIELQLDVRTVTDVLARHEWLPDLHERMRRLAAEQGLDDEILVRATGFLIEAVRESR